MKRLSLTLVLAQLLLLPLVPSALAAASSGVRFTTLAGFELDSGVPLSEVVKKLGPTPLQESGESGGYRARVCYRSADAVVSFLSDSLGGHYHELLGYAIALPAQADANGCGTARPPFVAQELAIGGLHLGMSRGEFSALLGQEVEWNGDSARRHFASRKALTPAQREAARADRPGEPVPEAWDITISILADFKGDALVSFEVWKISVD